MQKKLIAISVGLFGIVVAALIALFANRPTDVDNTQSVPAGSNPFVQEQGR